MIQTCPQKHHRTPTQLLWVTRGAASIRAYMFAEKTMHASHEYVFYETHSPQTITPEIKDVVSKCSVDRLCNMLSEAMYYSFARRLAGPSAIDDKCLEKYNPAIWGEGTGDPS